MKHYSVDDFLCNISCPYKIEVEKKINLLYDLRILRKVKRRIDSRENDVYRMFMSYESKIKLDNVVRGIIIGNYTLDELLEGFVI